MVSLILETILNFTLGVIGWGGYWGVFVLMALESANIPIPSEVIMPFSGFLALLAGPPAGGFNFWLVVLIGAFGNLAGSLFSYWLGYLIRHNVLHWNHHRVSAEVDRAQKWLDRWGDWAIFISRLLPVVRTFISFPLGILKTKSLWKFSYLTFGGSFIWSAFLAYLGFILGENWQVLHIYFRKFDYLIVGLAIMAGIFILYRKKGLIIPIYK
ncbi:DedA family protein [Candidatus Wolfebacteria bacterium]|nr:DedA family protein [Candidatus Wolfebacteria bacterium]